MSLSARYFDGKTSAGRDVEIRLYEDGRLQVSGPEVSRDEYLANIRISERIGNTTRRLTFADGASCELRDNDTLDAWLEHLSAHSAEHHVFRLERRWQYALAALVLTAFGSWAFIQWGLPAMADRAARILPRSIDMAIGRGGLEALDGIFFEPSQLAMAQQAQLHSRFDAMARDMDTGLDLQLELRQGGAIGANAFALPSGIIVMTDEMVELAGHPEEIEAVLAHEVGHIVHRHSLRMLLQSSASALLMFTLLGDVSSASTLAASIPTVLVQAKHSRDFEREADEFSFEWLERRGIPNHRFGDLLRRIEEQEMGERKASGNAANKKDEQGGVLSYFSSHPQTNERARK